MEDRDFTEFYAATNRAATAQVYAMIGNWHEAQEAVQEAYARALARWRQVSTYDDPLAWVRTVAYRVSVSRWRKAKRLVFSVPIDTAGVPDPMENHVALVAGLQRLPASQREALVLHYLVDLPVAQIAAQLGVPEGTVKARLSRGRSAMAELLGEDDGV
ncbi:MAG: SigE family RNA polymerase sigma factor [Geodermatophilaceae bacterium]|nr:SigE family RNA polymerase sigma factor [Geodermatophilaceae bacterium]